MLRIKQLREENNLSQRALAKKINANQKTVNFWERGVSEPSAGFVIALADVFECTTDYILGREDDAGSVNVMRELTAEERDFLALYARLDRRDRIEVKNFSEYLLAKRRGI